MDFTYGVPLFEKKDVERAFAFYHFGDEMAPVPFDLLDNFFEVTGDSKLRSAVVAMANMRKVHDYSFRHIFPFIMEIFKYKGYTNYGFTDVGGHQITVYAQHLGIRNLERNMTKYYWNNDISWFFYTPKPNETFEQMIKTGPYKDRIKEHHGVLYIQLCPTSDFCLIYDFYDDICKYL